MSDVDLTALLSEHKTWSFAPGTAYEYSNLGFVILGRVIQNAAGRNFREVVSQRIIEPLCMTNTVWSDELLDKQQLAEGYAREDDQGHTKGPRSAMSAASDSIAWTAQPLQTTGTFAALGGLYSTVEDLAIWVAGFLDAYPPRNGPDSHPLCRASRREMQEVVRAFPLQLGGGEGLARAQVQGYCLGLKSRDDLQTGRMVGHPGGYPGFGSEMDWHPNSGVGVIGLANGRYGGPYGTVKDVVAAVVAQVPVQLQLQPHAAVADICSIINKALIDGNFWLAESLFATNLGLDEALDQRAVTVSGLEGVHGALTPEEGFTVRTPTQVGWWLHGERGRVGISITLTPQSPAKVQVLNVTSVRSASAQLEAAAANGLVQLENSNNEFSALVRPIRRTSWVECDGLRCGSVWVEGAAMNVLMEIDLDATPVVNYQPS